MQIEYREWAKINNDLYGVFFDDWGEYAVLCKLSGIENIRNFDMRLAEKLFMPINEYNNRNDIIKFDILQLKRELHKELNDNGLLFTSQRFINYVEKKTGIKIFKKKDEKIESKESILNSYKEILNKNIEKSINKEEFIKKELKSRFI